MMKVLYIGANSVVMKHLMGGFHLIDKLSQH
jgi:hypothetical protein